jgi:hypothetical protein
MWLPPPGGVQMLPHLGDAGALHNLHYRIGRLPVMQIYVICIVLMGLPKHFLRSV